MNEEEEQINEVQEEEEVAEALENNDVEAKSKLVSIEKKAFRSCHSLTSIVFPESVQIIHKDCLKYCRNIKNN